MKPYVQRPIESEHPRKWRKSISTYDIPRPDECPKWCSRVHDINEFGGTYKSEEKYLEALRELREHWQSVAYTPLPRLSVGLTHDRTTRPGGQGWDMSLLQDDGLEGDDSTAPLVELVTHRHRLHPEVSERTTLRLTSAEALLLARQLTVAAERLEFER